VRGFWCCCRRIYQPPTDRHYLQSRDYLSARCRQLRPSTAPGRSVLPHDGQAQSLGPDKLLSPNASQQCSAKQQRLFHHRQRRIALVVGDRMDALQLHPLCIRNVNLLVRCDMVFHDSCCILDGAPLISADWMIGNRLLPIPADSAFVTFARMCIPIRRDGRSGGQ